LAYIDDQLAGAFGIENRAMLVVVIVLMIMAFVAVVLFVVAFGRASGGGGIFFDSASSAQRIAFQARAGEPCRKLPVRWSGGRLGAGMPFNCGDLGHPLIV
jgi:hypothetical protein